MACLPSSMSEVGGGVGSKICRKISLEDTKTLILVGVALWGLNFLCGVWDLGKKLKLHTALEISKINIY